MPGMKGDDTYLIDNNNDKIIEKNKQGFDLVVIALAFKLPNHVENLLIAGSGNVTAVANNLDNKIIGNKKYKLGTKNTTPSTVEWVTTQSMVGKALTYFY